MGFKGLVLPPVSEGKQQVNFNLTPFIFFYSQTGWGLHQPNAQSKTAAGRNVAIRLIPQKASATSPRNSG